MQCKYLLLNIPVEKISSFDEIESVDEAADKLDKSLEPFEGRVDKIPPEVEFWGHCSNLQVWAENNYDTRLLHRNLAFPLLKKLSDVGDPLARKVFKEEIIKRIREGNTKVINYLIDEQYFKYFSEEEFNIFLVDSNLDLLGKLSEIFNDREIKTPGLIIEFILDILIDIKINIKLLSSLVYETDLNFIKNLLLLGCNSGHEANIKEQVNEIFNEIKEKNDDLLGRFYRTIFDLFYSDDDIILYQLISFDLFKYLKKEDFLILFTKSNSKLKRNLMNLVKNKAGKYQTNQGYLHEQFFTFLVILCKKIEKTKVIQFLKTLSQDSKMKLQKEIRRQLEYLKVATSRYYWHIDNKELEEYLLKFLKVIE